MEEQVKAEEIKVEVVEEKKRFFTKKKIAALAGGALALGLGVVYLVTRGNSDSEGGSSDPIDVNYEPVTNSEVIE